jgi:hypothetical protein
VTPTLKPGVWISLQGLISWDYLFGKEAEVLNLQFFSRQVLYFASLVTDYHASSCPTYQNHTQREKAGHSNPNKR